MARIVTRRIKTYTYTTGKLNLETLTIENKQETVFPYRLGAREEKRLEAEKGGRILATDVDEILYGMSLEDFMTHAKPITEEEAADDVSNLPEEEEAGPAAPASEPRKRGRRASK